MCVPDVYFVVGRGSELETAALTGVRLLLSVVHAAVSDQLTLLSKTLVAVGATERLLACNKHRRDRDRDRDRERDRERDRDRDRHCDMLP